MAVFAAGFDRAGAQLVPFVDAAVAAAEHSLSLSVTRYRGGVANYLEVTVAQSAALSDQVTAVSILTRRITASVLLVKAVGGGWNVSQIPPL